MQQGVTPGVPPTASALHAWNVLMVRVSSNHEGADATLSQEGLAKNAAADSAGSAQRNTLNAESAHAMFMPNKTGACAAPSMGRMGGVSHTHTAIFIC